MSRTPGACCLIDVRTAALCQDQSVDQCAPGTQQPTKKFFAGSYLFENCQPPACGYDRGRDLASVVGASLIIATCIGVMHSFAVFIPSAAILYSSGYLELNVVAACSYFLLLIFACVAYFIVEYAGHKLTAIFGMTFVFLGILLDSQVLHIATLYIGNFLFGIGAGLAYAAAVSLPSDLFRVKILLALIIVDLGGPVGTIIFSWIGYSLVDVIGFKYSKLIVAILALFFTLAVHVFPKTRLLYTTDCQPVGENGPGKSNAVRQCVYQATAAEQGNAGACEATNNWLCVCVCDLRLCGDRSFLLWAILVMIATMNFHIPYLFLTSFAETVGAELSPWYITAYCLGSIVTRVIFIKALNFSFATNRALFQAGLLFSGIMWVVICWTETFGWIIVVSTFLGLLEGILCVVISRLTLTTVPSRWFASAWVSCILAHAFGMMLITIFTAVIAQKTMHYYVPFVTTGIIQIIAAFLAFLLPNEEGSVGGAPQAAAETTTVTKYKTSFTSGSGRADIEYFRSTYGMRSCTGVTTANVKKIIDYKCECPICTKIGCLPGCLPQTCTPRGSLNL